MIASVLIGLLSASPTCEADRAGYCRSTTVVHEIAYGTGARLKIDCALGDVVSIEFPEGVKLKGDPALGNRAIFEYRAQDTTPLRVLVWPRVPRGAKDVSPADLVGERGNLQVFLDSGAALLVDLRIGRAGRSVQRVVLRFPERERESEYVREQLAEQSRHLTEAFEREKAELEETVVERSRRRIARAVLDRVHCEDLDERAMEDLLVVRAHRLCRIGGEMLVLFEVHNRRRDLFHLQGVHVIEEGSDEGGHPSVLVEWSGQTTLPFDAQVWGVALFAVEGEAAKGYALNVVEDGGAQRSVTVDDIEF